MDFVVVAHWRAAKRDPKVTHRGAQPQEKPRACRPQAASTLGASVRFAAALCEISGSFLIFTLAPFTSGTTLNGLRFSLGSVASTPPQPPSPYEVTAATNRALLMKIERFCYHHEARDALVLSVAGVTAIMLIESLILLILY